MDRSKIAIIIPTFNEEFTIEKVVKSSSFFGVPIVVDDASNDRTVEKVKSLKAILISHKKNLGYDKTLNTGFKYASAQGYKYLITLDADNQHDINSIPEFIKYLDLGYDLVGGVRGKRNRIAEKIFCLFTKLLWGLSDPLCGLKAYNFKLYLDFGYFDSYQSIGTELLINARRAGKKIKQIDVKIFSRSDKPRFGNNIYANYKIFRALILTIYNMIKNK